MKPKGAADRKLRNLRETKGGKEEEAPPRENAETRRARLPMESAGSYCILHRERETNVSGACDFPAANLAQASAVDNVGIKKKKTSAKRAITVRSR